MQPKISVIIPVYNSEMFIADAINSVLAQRCFHGTEIIVIDDGSTDNTSHIVSKMSQEHKQIFLFKNERKKGPSGARNTGLIKAKGDYISFLDADDVWFDNHLEDGVTFLDNHKQADVVFFNFEIHEYESKQKIGDWFSEKYFVNTLKVCSLGDGYHLICDDMYSALIDESFMHLQSMIVRAKTIGSLLFNEEIERSEDRDFFIRLYLHSKAQFAFKNKTTGIYCRHRYSLTSNSVPNSIKTILAHIQLFSEYLSYDSNSIELIQKLKIALLEKHVDLGYNYRNINNHRFAFKHLFKSFKYGLSAHQLKEIGKNSVSSVLNVNKS